MAADITLEEFWDTAPTAEAAFDPAVLSALPEPARRWLGHAIAPGTPLARAVRIRMHGRIKLESWLPFRAEQVIRWDRGMIWQARTRMSFLPIRGSDRLIDGVGSMRWRMLGWIPVMNADGPDVTLSAAGRIKAESIWLPSVLLGPGVEWRADGSSTAFARFAYAGDDEEVRYDVGSDGRLAAVSLRRWGDPDDTGPRRESFGGRIGEERTFGGFTIASSMHVGWYFGLERFETEGAFFSATLDDVEYR